MDQTPNKRVILSDKALFPHEDGVYFSDTITVQEFLGVVRQANVNSVLEGYVQEPDVSKLVDEILGDAIFHQTDEPEIYDRNILIFMRRKTKSKGSELSLEDFTYHYIYYHDGSELTIKEV